MQENKFKNILLNVLPVDAIPVNISDWPKFPVPKKKALAFYIRGFGFIFATSSAPGFRKTKIKSFIEQPNIELSSNEQALFGLFYENYAELFTREGVYKVDYINFSFDALVNPSIIGEYIPVETDFEFNEKKKLFKREKFPNRYGPDEIIPLLDRISPKDIEKISKFTNYLIHNPDSQYFTPYIWRAIGIGVSRIIGDVFRYESRDVQEQAFELIARSVPFLVEKERLYVISELVNQILYEVDDLSMDTVDKISSIVLFSSGSVDPVDMKNIIRKLERRIDTKSNISSNLAKLIRKYS
jgi:hypothetical protein